MLSDKGGCSGWQYGHWEPGWDTNHGDRRVLSLHPCVSLEEATFPQALASGVWASRPARLPKECVQFLPKHHLSLRRTAHFFFRFHIISLNST